MKPLLTPVIFCGQGTNLYPLCDATSDSPSTSAKALLPVANRPLLAYALQNVLSAGLTSAIVLASASQHTSIVRALAEIRLITPDAGQPWEKKKGKEAKEEKVARTSIVFQEASMAAKATAVLASEGQQPQYAGTSVSSIPLRVTLLPLGPHDGSGQGAITASNTKSTEKNHVWRQRMGTAELLRWVSSLGLLEADPLVLPVDLIAPSFPLQDLIDLYVEAQARGAKPPTACCALYERGAGEGLGREREREGPSRLISAYSTDRDGGHRLVLVRDSDLDSDLAIKRALLDNSPRMRVSTRLLDAHAYILCRRDILPLLERIPRLTSLSDHVLPLIAKASWMAGLRKKAGFAEADHETSEQNGEGVEGDESQDVRLRLQKLVTDDDLQQQVLVRNLQLGSRPSFQRDSIQCCLHVVRLDQDVSGSGFVARANTVATYLECNRWLLKAIQGEQQTFAIPEIVKNPPADHQQPSSTSGQISADTLLGQGVTIGDRVSIKRSIIGNRCEIGRNSRLSGCVLMDGVKVADNVRMENVICCAGSSVAEKSTLKDCDVGAGVVVEAETNSKNEKIVENQGDDESEGDDDGFND